MRLHLTPARLALSCITLGLLVLALLAVPLWYGLHANVGTVRAYVPGVEMQRLVDLFHRDGPQAVAAAMDVYATTLPPDQVAIFAGPAKQRLAGNLARWPAEVPDVPGTYGLVIGLGSEASMRVVASHVALPDGYVLLMGRENVRFESSVERYSYGIAGAVAILLSLGLAFGWLLRRAHGGLETLVEHRTAALRLSEERYALAVQASGEGHWDWKIATDEFYASPRWREITGFGADEEFAGRAEALARFPFHPQDRPKYETAVADCLAGRSPGLEIELRIVPRGTLRWVKIIGICLRDAAGAPVRWAGSISDITGKKNAEQALQLSEERYSLAMEASEEGYIDVNVDTGEFATSERLNEIFGIAPGTRFRGRSDFLSKFRFYGDEGETYRQAIGAIAADGGPDRYQFEFRILLPSGEVRWIWTRGRVTRDAEGRARRRVGVFADITGRKLAEEALRRSESYLAEALRLGRAGSFAYDARAHKNVHWSPTTYEIFDFDPAAGLPTPEEIYRRVHPEDVARVRQARGEALCGKADYDAHYRTQRRDGTIRHLHAMGHPTLDANGEVVELVGVVTDVTERKRAEQALRLSEERYARAMEGSDAGHWDWNIVTDEMFISERAREMLALPAGALPERRAQIMERVPMHPDDRAAMNEKVAAGIRSGTHERDYRVIPRPGEVRWVRSRAKVYRDAEGAAVRMTGSLVDITERKLAADALRASEERYSLAMEAAEEGHFDWDVRTDEIFVSAHIRKVLDLPLEAAFGKRDDLVTRIRYHPDDRIWLDEMPRKIFASSALRHEFEYRILREREVRWLRARWKIFRDAAGVAQRVIGVVTDVTERKRATDELRTSEARFRALTELSSDWYWRQDEELRFTYVSHQVADDRYPLDCVIGKRRWELRGVTPLSSGWAEHQAVLAARQPFRDFEYLRAGQEGRTEYISISGAPIFDEHGLFRGYQGVGRNITERRHAEEELDALERKLRQAQRLEAMGTLAGGIAHDFNNILGAILGYGEMAMRDAAKGSRLKRDLDSIMAAGERGRALVDRVLAFSRSGVGERVPVHVEKVVREALDLLSARLPPDITLHAKLHAESAAIQGDATQVHQVLMNLATNAIQAMAGGGTLRVSLHAERIEQARASTIGAVAPGDYLVLQVADTGSGMSPGILDRIFDPFFTTKEVGTGTGLGLSLVHGIVTELDGAIDVASAVGTGTTFTVYLPRAGDAAEAAADEELALPRGDGQRVLVVDDEEPLVKLATRTLEELGYAPVGFTSSNAALAAFRADPQRFDALITDERMPGMSGTALIREVRGIRDRIPVVLMSGYVGGALASRAREAGAEEVLKKPLSARDLAASLARVLHSQG